MKTAGAERDSSRAVGTGWEAYRRLILGRSATCIVILLLIGLVHVGVHPVPDALPIVGLMVYLLALSLPYYLLGRGLPTQLRTLGLSVVVLDTLHMPVGQYLLGGENAVYGLPLYGILVVMAATLHSREAAYGVALLAACAYGAMVAALRVGWLPPFGGPEIFALEGSWAVVTGLTNLFFGLTLAGVASTLSGVKDRALARSSEAEARLAQLNRELESRVEEAVRAERDANASLAKRNDDLRATLRQVNLFAGAVSHDLRNPLTAANEALRIARDATDRPGGPDRPEGPLLELAAENLGRADAMVVGLRDLMRTVGAPAGRERIAVRPLLQELLRELRAARVGEPLPVSLEGDFGEVEAHPEHLKLVFRNLITNALEHNEDRPVRVAIAQEGHGPECVFCVRDDGRGIPESLRKRIFEPFRRGLEARAEGLGLGLAIVSAIVGQAGGRVWLDSPAEGGAAFRFAWPREPADAEDPGGAA